MSDAREVVKSWLKAIGKGAVATTTQYLSPNLDWQENGLSHAESTALHRRPKWQGIQSKKFKYSAKFVVADGRNAVVEFTATHEDQQYHYCAIFKVARGKITSAHWYGDPKGNRQMVKVAAAA